MSEDVVGKEASSSSTSGVWEQSSGLRWQLVGEQEERIPSRSRTSSRRDGPVDPGLSIQVALFFCFAPFFSAQHGLRTQEARCVD